MNFLMPQKILKFSFYNTSRIYKYTVLKGMFIKDVTLSTFLTYLTIFINFSFFWHWASFFLFSSIKIINSIYNKKRKKEKANVSAMYGGPIQCHKLKD